MNPINKIINTSLVILLFIPFLYLSFIFADFQYGDNAPYATLYNFASNNSFIDIYTFQLASINASEPMMALIIYIFSSLKLSYPFFIVVTNLFFIYILIKFSSIFQSTSMQIPLALMLYFATDFYVLKMFIELHRLKLGIAFLLLVLIANRNMKVLYFMAGVLSHLQILLFSPYFFNKIKQNFFMIPLSFLVIIYFFSDYITDKFLYYLSGSGFETALIIIIISFFTFILATLLKLKDRINIFKIAFLILFFSLFIGGDRILFIFFEAIILYLFFQFYNMKEFSNKLPLLIIFTTFLVSVNLFRVNLYLNGLAI
jgi:hypothetical protein